jgi:signal transduction histidine kinase/DNA-binding response OmpR family regulator
MRGDRIRRGMFIVRSSWGTERHLACSAGPILTARGEPAGAAMVVRDVSDEHQYAEMLRHTNRELRRQAEVLEEVNQQLREATKAKDQFLAVMSHELRTPINAIMGYSDLLDLGVKGDLNPEQHAMIARIRETSRHLLGLINEVLDLAKIGAGRIDLVLTEVNVGTIVERAAQQILPMATAKGLTLETVSDVPADAPARAIADETRLAQIVINLLSNAVKFTSSGGVSVRYGLSGEQVIIAVHDTGPGIPPEQLDRIFEEFYQIEGGLSRSTGGTGLGLSIARRFAHLMGGDITVESQVGVGSEFVLSLPEARREVAREGPGPIVVLAGSEELARRITAGLDNNRVAATTEPARLLSLAHVETPEMVVLDLATAAHGAWRTLLAMQMTPEIAHVPVLLLGRDRKSDEAMDLGRVRILPRPFSVEEATAEIAGSIAPENGAPVLIAIDEPTVRGSLADALSSSGHGVLTAGETHTALDLVVTQHVSAIVAELMLEADGHALGLLAHVRSDAALREVPVFLLVNQDPGPEELTNLERVIDRLGREGRTPRLSIPDLIRAALDESAPVEAR